MVIVIGWLRDEGATRAVGHVCSSLREKPSALKNADGAFAEEEELREPGGAPEEGGLPPGQMVGAVGGV